MHREPQASPLPSCLPSFHRHLHTLLISMLLAFAGSAQAAFVQTSIEWEVVNSGFDSSIPEGFQGVNLMESVSDPSGGLLTLGLTPSEQPPPDGMVPSGGPLPSQEGLALVDGRRLHAYARTELPADGCDFSGNCGYSTGSITWSSSWNVRSIAQLGDDVVVSAGPAYDGLPALVRIAWRAGGYLFDQSVGTQNLGGAMVSASFGLGSVTRTVRAVAVNEPEGAEELVDVDSLSNFRVVLGETFAVNARLETAATVLVGLDDATDDVTTLSDFASTLEFGPILEVLVDTDENGSFETILTDGYMATSALGLDYLDETVPEPGFASMLSVGLLLLAGRGRRG